MSITINAKGTSVPFFTIGKNGTTIYQGNADPSVSYTLKNGDFWLNSNNNSLESWSDGNWKAPRLADINFTGNTITSTADLNLNAAAGNNVVFGSGTLSTTLTTAVGNDLVISEAIGGSLYISQNKWPSVDGSSGQILVTDGSGILTWTTPVTTISGTSNQVVVSSSTGNPAISLSSTLIAPGSLEFTTNFGFAMETIVAAGSTYSDATVITKSFSKVTTANVLYGVKLPLPSFTGQYHTISNCGTLQFYIYPSEGTEFIGNGINVPTYLTTDQTTMFIWDGEDWHPVRSIIKEGNAGISVDNQQGTVFISNNGVLSFSGGTTGLTPVTASNGDIVLGGTLTIGAGGTGATTSTTAFNNLSPLTTQGDLLYFNSGNNTRLSIGTTGQVLGVNPVGHPSWTDQSTLSVGAAVTATKSSNISNGVVGDIPYQTSANTTSFLNIGSTNQVLTVVGGIPTWQNVTTSIGYTPLNKAGDTMSGTLSMGNHNITNLLAPTNPNDAATKEYVDAASGGLTIQTPVRVAQLVDLTTIGSGNSGPIATIGTITSGSGYTSGTYTNVPLLSNGIGAGAYATIVVTAGEVVSCTITTPGNRYVVGDKLYATESYIGEQGVGFETTVATVSANYGIVTYTDGTSDENGGLGIGATLTPASNGLFVLDGVAFNLNDRILIKAQTNTIENGIYTITSVGSPTTTWELTRATDYDNSVINQVCSGNYIFVTDGVKNKNTSWVETTIGTSSVPGAKSGSIIIGTDNITYNQFSAANTYTAGTGIVLIGNEFSNTGVLTVTTGSGLSTNTSATGDVSITNTGVTSLTAGTGISLSGSTGSITVSTSGVGSVTSVGLSLPSIFSVTGSPVTTSGTLTATLGTQSINTVLAGPTIGTPSVPTFRTLGLATNDINDVTITSATSGQVLSYNGSRWVNTTTNNTAATANVGVTPTAGGTAWSLVSGTTYNATFTHNLGTQNLTITVYDTVDNSVVIPDYITTPTTNTIVIQVKGNTKTLRIVAVANGLSMASGASSISTQLNSVSVSVGSDTLNFTGPTVNATSASSTTSVFVGTRSTFFATSLDSPNTADYAVNAFAPTTTDPTYSSLSVRSFSNTVEQGVGSLISIPTGATNITIKIRGRSATAPASTSNVQFRLYTRQIPDNSVISSWSAGTDLTLMSIPTNANFQLYTNTATLSSLGLTAGSLYQLELTRYITGVTSNLAYNFYMAELTVEIN